MQNCILLSPTVVQYLIEALEQKSLVFRTNENSFRTISDFEIHALQEVTEFKVYLKNRRGLKDVDLFTNQVEIYLRRRLTKYQELTIQYMTSLFLCFAGTLIQDRLQNNCNRHIYMARKVASSLFKLSSNIGCVSEILYLAMYYYKYYEYEKSLRILNKAQEKMCRRYVIYKGDCNVEMFRYALLGESLNGKMRKAFVDDVILLDIYTYISELVPEQKTNQKNYGVDSGLCCPPLVMLHLLLVLNHHKLGDTARSQQSLQDLHTLMLCDEGLHVPVPLRDISWHILGICQQVCEDHRGAFDSYQSSLKERPFLQIQQATYLRMLR